MNKISFSKIGIVNYGMGNLGSVVNVFKHLGHDPYIILEPKDVEKADVIILPGVGAFGEAMTNLHERRFVDVLSDQVLVKKKFFLGICLGMQLLAESSEEKGAHRGLGWIPGHVKKLNVDSSLRLPHMGWNDLIFHGSSPIYSSLSDSKAVYFVHTYYFDCDSKYIDAYVEYGKQVTASIHHDNIFAVQYHPEKSHSNGLKILSAFLQYTSQA